MGIGHLGVIWLGPAEFQSMAGWFLINWDRDSNNVISLYHTSTRTSDMSEAIGDCMRMRHLGFVFQDNAGPN